MRYGIVLLLMVVAMPGIAAWVAFAGDSGSRRGEPAVNASSGSATAVTDPIGLGLGRTGLYACIESSTPVDPQVFVDTANRIVDELVARQGSAPGWLRGASAVAGCPPLASRVSPEHPPSKYRLHIRVVPGWHPAPGAPPYVKGGAETYCMGDACAEQTIVLTVPNLDPDVLFDAVVGGLGLYAAVLPPHWTPPWN